MEFLHSPWKGGSGRSFPNGCGICAKNSASSGSLPRCASPSFPPPHTEALPSRDLSVAGSSFGPPHWAHAARRGSFGGQDFFPQPDGTLRCQQGATLYPQERRPEHDGTIRVLYAARIADCRCCPLRICCQGHGTSTRKTASGQRSPASPAADDLRRTVAFVLFCPSSCPLG